MSVVLLLTPLVDLEQLAVEAFGSFDWLKLHEATTRARTIARSRSLITDRSFRRVARLRSVSARVGKFGRMAAFVHWGAGSREVADAEPVAVDGDSFAACEDRASASGIELDVGEVRVWCWNDSGEEAVQALSDVVMAGGGHEYHWQRGRGSNEADIANLEPRLGCGLAGARCFCSDA
jgi:hypothetical protein